MLLCSLSGCSFFLQAAVFVFNMYILDIHLPKKGEKNCPFSWKELLFILMFNRAWALHFECSLVFKWNRPFRTGKLEDCVSLDLQSIDCVSLEWVLWLVFYSIFFSPCCLHHVQLSHLLEIQGSFICSHLCLICMVYFHSCWLCKMSTCLQKWELRQTSPLFLCHSHPIFSHLCHL